MMEQAISHAERFQLDMLTTILRALQSETMNGHVESRMSEANPLNASMKYVHEYIEYENNQRVVRRVQTSIYIDTVVR